MDLTKPEECNSQEQAAFIKFVKSLADENIKKNLETTSEKCLGNDDIKSSLKMKGLEKLQKIYPENIKLNKIINEEKSWQAKKRWQRTTRAVGAIEVMKKDVARKKDMQRKAATTIQAAIREKQSRKAAERSDKRGGKRKSKKRHYKHIVKIKTIRKKNVKRRRTKKKRQDK
jgi:hypothetical protein